MSPISPWGIMKISQKVDLLIIDGPSGGRFTEAAKDFYQKTISSRTVCVVDDTNREENNKGSKEIARQKSLKKMDFGDPMYDEGHRYSILFPKAMEKQLKLTTDAG